VPLRCIPRMMIPVPVLVPFMGIQGISARARKRTGAWPVRIRGLLRSQRTNQRG